MNTGAASGGLAMVVVLLAGCSAQSEPGGLCPLSLERDGDTYYALKTQHRVRGEEPLAPVGFACITDDEAGREDARARFPARSLPGIDPAVAFAVPSRWPRYIFYSGPSNASSFPPEVERLLRH
ncbi:MAG: hypothetical protein ACXVX9_08150 [Mycobacteriaceae bacterium]